MDLSQDAVTPPSDDVVQADLDRFGKTIQQGEAAKSRRATLIRQLHHDDPERWTQTHLAAMAGISQAAVSKMVRQTPGERSLEEATDPAYVVGRILGIGEFVGVRLLRCDSPHQYKAGRMIDKMLQGTQPINPHTLRQLEQLMNLDLSKATGQSQGKAKAAQFAYNLLRDCHQRLDGELPTVTRTTAQSVQLWLGYDHQRGHLMYNPSRFEQPAQED